MAELLVGKKPMMNYVLAAVGMVNEGETELVIKARGRNISKAVAIAEVLRNRFLKDFKVKDIKIGTEMRDGSSVSIIEIYLAK